MGLPPPHSAGFTLVECVIVCAIVAVVASLALPGLRGQDLRAGRTDAVDALTRVQAAQEQYRAAHGLYAAEFSALLGTAPTSRQGRYALSITLTGPEAYVAAAQAQGAQAHDKGCATLTLEVRQGFAQAGPQAACWLR